MDNEAIRRSILADVDEVVSRLACALTLAASPTLQAEVRRFAGLAEGAAFAGRLPVSDCWVLVSVSGAARPVRQPPRGVAAVELEAPFDAGAPLRPVLEAATDQVGGFPQAFGLLTPLFDPASPRTRGQMVELIRWAPTFEILATRISTHAVMLVDALRKEVLFALDAQAPEADLRVREYVGLLRMIADLQLLAADDGARPRLEGLGRSFEWRQWTPSWPLVRERLVEFTPAAAWSAQAFGPSFVQSYLDALVRSNHLALVLDALFGLIAIALSAPSEARTIAAEIQGRRDFIQTPVPSESSHVAWLVAAAAQVIATPEAATRGLAQATGFRGALKPDRLLPHVLTRLRTHDPADPVGGGAAPLAFAILPLILAGRRADAYPPAPLGELPAAAMSEGLRRAWGGSQRPPPVTH
jgi:hypothetical protein